MKIYDSASLFKRIFESGNFNDVEDDEKCWSGPCQIGKTKKNSLNTRLGLGFLIPLLAEGLICWFLRALWALLLKTCVFYWNHDNVYVMKIVLSLEGFLVFQKLYTLSGISWYQKYLLTYSSKFGTKEYWIAQTDRLSFRIIVLILQCTLKQALKTLDKRILD